MLNYDLGHSTLIHFHYLPMEYIKTVNISCNPKYLSLKGLFTLKSQMHIFLLDR